VSQGGNQDLGVIVFNRVKKEKKGGMVWKKVPAILKMRLVGKRNQIHDNTKEQKTTDLRNKEGGIILVRR